MTRLLDYLAPRAGAVERLVGLGCLVGGVGAQWGAAWAAMVFGFGILVAPYLPRRRG